MDQVPALFKGPFKLSNPVPTDSFYGFFKNNYPSFKNAFNSVAVLIIIMKSMFQITTLLFYIKYPFTLKSYFKYITSLKLNFKYLYIYIYIHEDNTLAFFSVVYSLIK